MKMENNFPKINFIGNKEKLSDWIASNFQDNTSSLFDAFSGGCSIAYKAKKLGYKVITNDALKVNYHISKALIQNNNVKLNDRDICKIFSGKPKKGFIFKNYSDVFFYPEECMELDQYWYNINTYIKNPYKKSLALSLIRRSMIRKRTYSRFNIVWKKVKQLRDEDYSYEHYKRRRAYHNQTFKTHFLDEVSSYNNAIFDNGKKHKAYNKNVFNIIDKIEADIIYLDPPYPGTMNDYFGFYGFLDEFIDQKKMKPFKNNFTNRDIVTNEFDCLFSKTSNFKHLLLSFNSKSFPKKDDMLNLLRKYFNEVSVIEKEHNYQITGKQQKTRNKEYLFKASK